MNQATARVLRRLSSVDIARLKKSSQVAQALENRWRSRADQAIQGYIEKIIQTWERTGEFQPGEIDFGTLFLTHAIDIQREAYELATSDLETHIDPTAKLRRPKVSRIQSLFEMWDKYRTRRILPKRQKAHAEAVKQEFLKKVQDVFRRHSEDFRKGDVYDREQAVEALRKAGKTTYSRAKMIIETETTYYYNQTRREVYDSSPDVGGYLFLAIRDSATTKWCKTRTGLVYHRDDPHLDSETPPIHWNCRSEVLPLVFQNPRHLRLLHDKSLDRRKHTCEPLPRGWKSSRIAA